MISRKTLGILAGILVVLGLLSTLTGRSRYSTAEGGGFVPILENIDPASVQTITAWLGSKPDESVELSRAGDGWSVTSRWGWTAKEDLVQRLVHGVTGGDTPGNSHGVYSHAGCDIQSQPRSASTAVWGKRSMTSSMLRIPAERKCGVRACSSSSTWTKSRRAIDLGKPIDSSMGGQILSSA